MMETEPTAGSCPDPSQTVVRTWVSFSTRGPPSEAISRFHGDGVRYKAKLIGTDPVLDAQGEKMCWDSMMKLKGFEAAGRKQGKHKQRVWLKVSSGGLKIVDEKTGAVLYDHDRTRISSLTKDESDPRALAYVYQHQDSYNLFYIKMANLADPVLTDIKEVCQGIHRLIPQGPAEPQAQNNALLLLSDSSTHQLRFHLWRMYSVHAQKPYQHNQTRSLPVMSCWKSSPSRCRILWFLPKPLVPVSQFPQSLQSQPSPPLRSSPCSPHSQ
nr:disabled homolog 2-like [Labrus bergylta]XP_029137459.1 disabled homolog 2-like [Labrus bergylta]